MGVPLKYDYTGYKFNSWVVIKRVSNPKNRISKWLCKCEVCGTERTFIRDTVRKGQSICTECQKRKEKLAYLLTQEAVAEYHRCYPDADISHPNVVYHLDGDKNNNDITNLYLTTNTKLHNADLRLMYRTEEGKWVRYSMFGINPELREVRKTMLMLVDLERLITKYESEF